MSKTFSIKTEAQEQAYRLGYVEGWAHAQVAALSRHYREMDIYLAALRDWKDKPPEVGSCPPELTDVLQES